MYVLHMHDERCSRRIHYDIRMGATQTPPPLPSLPLHLGVTLSFGRYGVLKAEALPIRPRGAATHNALPNTFTEHVRGEDSERFGSVF
jgi:hypothetical protein